MAEELLLGNDPGQAISELEAADALAPDRVDILEPLAFAYRDHGDGVLAALTFVRLSELQPGREEYLLYAAEALASVGDQAGEAEHFRQYLRAVPGDAAVWQMLADAEERLNRPEAAIRALTTAQRLQPKRNRALRLGKLFQGLGTLTQANYWFSEVLPGNDELARDALLGQLEIALRERRWADAEELITRTERDFPGAVATSEFSDAPAQLREWRDRQAALAAATAQISPTTDSTTSASTQTVDDDSGSQTEVADGGASVDRIPTEAEGTSTGARSEDPADIASAEASAGAAASETSETTTSANTAPAPPPLTEATMGNTAPPLAMVSQGTSSARTPQTAAELLAAARRAAASGNLEEAARYYRQTLALDDTFPEVWAELSQVQLELSRLPWAEAAALEAVRREPTNIRWRLQYLSVAQRALPPSRFLQELVQAYEAFPRSPEIMLALARAYTNIAGNRRNARLLYERFLEIAPSHPQAGEVRNELAAVGG